MIDRDGIERPDDTTAHTFAIPQNKRKRKDKLSKEKITRSVVLNFFSYLLRIFVYVVLSVFYFFKFRLALKGRKHKRALRGSAVVEVANHCHFLDVTFFAVKFMPRMLYITSVPQNFDIPVAGTLIKILGAIPLASSLKETKVFKKIIDGLLDRKKAVLFMPEASMWMYYRDLRPFKNGAFRFAVRHNSPVLPTVTTVKLIHKSLKRTKRRITLNYLPAIYPDNTLPEPEAVEKLKNETHRAMSNLLNVSASDDVYTRRYRRQNANATGQTQNDKSF